MGQKENLLEIIIYVLRITCDFNSTEYKMILM
jgi:hypothetical protein